MTIEIVKEMRPGSADRFGLPASLRLLAAAAVALGSLAIDAGTASAGMIRVSIENIGPSGGPTLTPVFAGFHDGSFDLFDTGSFASEALERIAEDGTTGPLESEFAAPGRVSQVVGGLTGPGQSASSGAFDADVMGANRYLTIASMVVPTSDFFVGNSNPLALDLSTLKSVGSLTFDLTRVYDAGTEINDFATSAANFLFAELPAGQSGPNQGAVEGLPITLVDATDPYAGYLNRPDGFDPGLAGVRVTVQAVPEPASIAVMAGLGMLAGLTTIRRRRRAVTVVSA